MTEPRRGLDGTGISIWQDCHTEHMAVRAAELGDAQTERLCDAVLAGSADGEDLIDLVEVDDAWFVWMLRGNNEGWRRRST